MSLTNLWKTIRSWVTDNAVHQVHVVFPDPQAALPDIIPMRGYLRVWLSEMFLAKSRDWFVDVHPAVHAQVRLKFAGREVEIGRVAQPPKDALGKGVHVDYALSSLLPYNGGTVEIEAALLALAGTNQLQAVIGILKGFSDLVGPPLASALTIADQVGAGMQQLMGVTDGQVHLGYHQQFGSQGGGGANVLRPGYIAVVLANADEVKPGDLSVIAGRLHHRGQPLVGRDYLLLRIEGRNERDDWLLPDIQAAMDRAVQSAAEGDDEKSALHRAAAITAALTSPDLVMQDRRRVVEAIKAHLADVSLGAAPVANDLGSLVKAHAGSVAQAMVKGPLTLSEAMADPSP